MKKLDRNRSYGEIHGTSKAKFVQDNKYFDAHGVLIEQKHTCDCGRDFSTEHGLKIHKKKCGGAE